MTPPDLLALFEAHDIDDPPAVTVTSADYKYDGWVIMVGYKKRSRALRCAVEDEHGRIFIHNATQLRAREVG